MKATDPRRISAQTTRIAAKGRLDQLCENIAEIAVAVGEHGRRAYDAMALQPEASREAPGDLVRNAILEAGRVLSEIEVANPRLWERHDWRATCDALAEAICSGVRRFDVSHFLR